MDRSSERAWRVTETAEGEDRIACLIGSPASFGVPAPIPPTTPLRYVWFMVALNLRVEGENTGDWHFEGAVYTDPVNPLPLPLAGQGEAGRRCARAGSAIWAMF